MTVHLANVPKAFSSILLALTTAFTASCGSFPKITHVPPGNSAQIALAKRAIPVSPLPDSLASSQESPANLAGVPAVEPDLPLKSGSSERVIDAFNHGNALLDEGKSEEAILAFQRVIKINPGFEEAWIKLALCYQNLGEEQKATETLKKFKAMAPN